MSDPIFTPSAITDIAAEANADSPYYLMGLLASHEALRQHYETLTDKLRDYEMAAKYPGDDQRHRGVSVATQLVHCQHKREQAEAQVETLLAQCDALVDLADEWTAKSINGQAGGYGGCAARLREALAHKREAPTVNMARLARLEDMPTNASDWIDALTMTLDMLVRAQDLPADERAAVLALAKSMVTHAIAYQNREDRP